MPSIPDDRNRPASPGHTEPGWQVSTGLSLIQAENLLDQLEAFGVREREMRLEAGGVTVRWRTVWPRLAGD